METESEERVVSKTVAYYEKKTDKAKLIIWNRNNQIIEKNIGNRCLIGRKTDDSMATVQIDSALVSRKHGEIFCKDGEYYYKCQ